VFGWQNYLEWVRTLGEITWTWGHSNASILGFLSRTFSENPMYEPWEVITNIYLLWFPIVGVIGIITTVATTWGNRHQSIDRSFSLLLLAAFLISPLGWIYYFFFLLGPITAIAYSWKNEWFNTDHKQNLTATHFRNSLFLLGILGLLLPSLLGVLFQPNPVATMSLASMYFWSILLLWGSLTLDWFTSQKSFKKDSSGVGPQNQKLNLLPRHDAKMVNENVMNEGFEIG